MVYDLKTCKKYISSAVEPANIDHLWNAPFLIVNQGSDYICSKLKIDSGTEGEQNIWKRTFEFSFNYRKIFIKESLVTRIDYYRKSEHNSYQRVSLDFGTILSGDDLDDFLLVVYKQCENFEENSSGLKYDISIYDSSSKICSLKNVRGLLNNKVIHKDKILFLRIFYESEKSSYYNQRWVFMNGNEYSENELNLSLSEWNDIFNPSSNSFWNIKKLYSPKNKIPFSSKDIFWNTNTPCEWQCSLEHCWIAPVNQLTKKTVFNNYCPVCCEMLPHFSLNSDEADAQRTYDKVKLAQTELQTNDISETIDALEEEIAELQEMHEMGILWFDHAKMSDTVNYYFAYPNGKHGDIDKAICETFGEVVEVGESVYMAKIPTNYYEEIELLSESYANKELIKNFDNADIKLFLSKHNVMHRLKYLSSIAHQFKMPTNRYAVIDREMTQYRAPLRVKRTEIYNKLVGENKATRKWTSEQLLYHLVKSVFSDAVFQYKTKWLGNQSLDIFVPSINLGIEYQGKQHYEPVKLFGGEEQFKERLILDEKKRTLCKDNGITLIEWKYNTEISELNLKIILKNWL